MSGRPVTLTVGQVRDLSGLLGGLMSWLTFGDRDSHRNLVRHLIDDAARNGGPFDGLAHDTFSELVDLVDRYGDWFNNAAGDAEADRFTIDKEER